MKGLVLTCLFFGLMIVACGDKEESQAQPVQDSTNIQKDTTTDSTITDENTTASDTQTESKGKTAAELYIKCAACHGANGDKVAPGSVGNVLISNLDSKQISDALKGYRAKTLSKGGNSVIMYMQTSKLSDEDIDALSKYIPNLKK